MSVKILVTGANGQLATCIKDLESLYPNFSFIYTSSSDMNLTSQDSVNRFFKENNMHWCINCAAYTAVDKAESDIEPAYNVNALGVRNLALACKNKHVKLIHVSTDFVFDGQKSTPYNEEDQTNPLGVYGASKLKGEEEIINSIKEYFIVRTSWLYSEYGNNFMKTMLRLVEGRNELSVVDDQVGTPTYAKDLAEVLLKILELNSDKYGIYHYSNEGVASWYDFAKAIFEISSLKIKVNPIPSEKYPAPAKRPSFSVLDKHKIKETMSLEIPYWRYSLQKLLTELQ